MIIKCIFLIIICAALVCMRKHKPSCYRDEKSNVTKICTGDGCSYRDSCKYFINHLNDE